MPFERLKERYRESLTGGDAATEGGLQSVFRVTSKIMMIMTLLHIS
jgi:hypothetical protein